MGLYKLIYIVPFVLVKNVIHIICSLIRAKSPIRQTDHFAPHPSSAFEGYYSRTQLEDGGSLAIVFCSVKKATKRPHLVYVALIPGEKNDIPGFEYELYPDQMDFDVESRPIENGRTQFTLTAPGIGALSGNSEGAEYTLSVPDHKLSLTLRLTAGVHWSPFNSLDGPMGLAVDISDALPINWHVGFTDAVAEYSITHDDRTRVGRGRAHMEKNWGDSFPTGWLWAQSFDEDGRSFCVAGGTFLPGVQSCLIGYRSAQLQWDFGLPYTVAIGSLSPFMDIKHDSRSGTVKLTVQTFRRKIIVEASAPPTSFIGIPGPLADGHRPNYCLESFQASHSIVLQERRWPWGEWTTVESGLCGITAAEIPCGVLEFGGDFHHLQKRKCS